MAVGDEEDNPPLEHRPLAAPVLVDPVDTRELDTQPDNAKPTSRPPHDGGWHPEARTLDELARLRPLLEGIRSDLRKVLAQGEQHGRELGKIKSFSSATALEVAQLQAPGIKPNGLSGKRVLVVDDEERILDVCERVLGDLGCNVTAASSRLEAETILAAMPRPFHLALVDLHLPDHTDGLELCRWISAAHPATRLLVMTGYQRPELDEIPAARLEKAFNFSELRGAVYRALGMVDAVAHTEPPPPFPPAERVTEASPRRAPDSPQPDTAHETPEAKRAD